MDAVWAWEEDAGHMGGVDTFDNYVDRYEDWFLKHKFAYLSELEALKYLLPEFKDGIEIGVGTGRFASQLGIKTGIEPSNAMANIAVKRGIKVIKGSGESIPFPNGRFDLALIVTTICFFDNAFKALSESYRILKPSGYILLGFVDAESPVGKFYLKHKNENVFYKYAFFFTVQEVTTMLRDIGFKDLKYAQTIFRNLSEIDRVEEIKDGYGKGSFVALRARKEEL